MREKLTQEELSKMVAQVKEQYIFTNLQGKRMLETIFALGGRDTANCKRRNMENLTVKCPTCGGDGKETCNNPDHNFIASMPGEIGRLGCPGCGHDPKHKTRDKCPVCNGAGVISVVPNQTTLEWIGEMTAALHQILSQQPCTNNGGCFYPMHDGEGNYIGEQQVDPMSVVQGMAEIAGKQLSRLIAIKQKLEKGAQ